MRGQQISRHAMEACEKVAFNSTPRLLHSLGKNPGTHWIGDWVVLRSDLDDLGMRTSFAAAVIGNQLLGHPVCNQVSVPIFGTLEAVERARGKRGNCLIAWSRSEPPSVRLHFIYILAVKFFLQNTPHSRILALGCLATRRVIGGMRMCLWKLRKFVQNGLF
jgi:hypothetical protein